jgi:hypothetical protein
MLHRQPTIVAVAGVGRVNFETELKHRSRGLHLIERVIGNADAWVMAPPFVWCCRQYLLLGAAARNCS